MTDQTTPTADSPDDELARATAAMIELVERLDELEIEATEPATTFTWPAG